MSSYFSEEGSCLSSRRHLQVQASVSFRHHTTIHPTQVNVEEGGMWVRDICLGAVINVEEGGIWVRDIYLGAVVCVIAVWFRDFPIWGPIVVGVIIPGRVRQVVGISVQVGHSLGR